MIGDWLSGISDTQTDNFGIWVLSKILSLSPADFGEQVTSLEFGEIGISLHVCGLSFGHHHDLGSGKCFVLKVVNRGGRVSGNLEADLRG